MQPKSHHRAHYETEGSRGAVKASAGGHPSVQVRGRRPTRAPVRKQESLPVWSQGRLAATANGGFLFLSLKKVVISQPVQVNILYV